MKILSLDIGSHSVKAIELESLFGRLELKDYFLERVQETLEAVQPTAEVPATEKDSGQPAPKSLDPVRRILSQGQLDAIKRVVNERPMRQDRLVVGLPRNLVTTRLLNFPTKDRKVITKTIAFELEDELPVPLEDAVYDFSIIQAQGTTGTTVYVCIALKKDLVSLLRQLQDLGLDPDAVSTEGWAMSQLLSKAVSPEAAGAPACIVNMGAHQTVLHMMVAERPVMTHAIPVGGDHITHSIAAHYGLATEQAEKAKVDGGFLLTREHFESPDIAADITDEQKRFAESIGDALIPIIREIRQALTSFRSQYHMMPQRLLLTGGSSLIPNLPLYLEEALDMKVEALAYSTKVLGESLQLSESTEAHFSSAMGYALSTVKTERGANINLRKNEFAKHSGLSALSLTAFRRPLKYMAASLAFIYATLMVQYLVLSNRYAKQEESMERAIKSVLGTVTKSSLATYSNSPSTLKSAVNKEISKFKPSAAEPEKKRLSALDVLHKFSQTVPKDLVLDVSTFDIKDGRLEMKGLLGQPTDAERLAKLLEDTKLVTDFNRGTPAADPVTRKTKFEFKAKIAEAPSAGTSR